MINYQKLALYPAAADFTTLERELLFQKYGINEKICDILKNDPKMRDEYIKDCLEPKYKFVYKDWGEQGFPTHARPQAPGESPIPDGGELPGGAYDRIPASITTDSPDGGIPDMSDSRSDGTDAGETVGVPQKPRQDSPDGESPNTEGEELNGCKPSECQQLPIAGFWCPDDKVPPWGEHNLPDREDDDLVDSDQEVRKEEDDPVDSSGF
jgi:hypothetical protein